MALSRVKTWIAGEILSAADLNAEFNNILSNAASLFSPLTGTLDLDGNELILDSDGDTSITASVDDQIDFRLGGADDFAMTANKFDVLAGSTLKVTGIETLTKGSDVASATDLLVGIDGNIFDVTGTTTIATIATKGVGTVIKLHFDAILTLTHHATNLILPGGANITTAAGDEAEFYEYASADWRCTKYTTASGQPVTQIATASIANLAVDTAQLAANAVTGAKIAMGSDAQGDVLFYGGADYERLAPGVSGYFLKTQGAAADPIWAAPGLPSPDFTSSEQTVTTDTKLDVAHSLGAIPALVQVVLRCKTTDLGYAVGDEVIYHGNVDLSLSVDRGAIIMSDSTNVTIIQGLGIALLGKSTFNVAGITVGNWKWVVRAWS
jgi:hypothetical protein